MGKYGDKIKPEPSTPSLSSSFRKKKYRGIRMRKWGSWVSEIRAPDRQSRIWLGSYSTPEAAARAYDAALLCLKGPTANLNFPINPSLPALPPQTITSPKSIKKVAAAAANSFYTESSATTTPLSSSSHTHSPSSPSPSPSWISSPFDQPVANSHAELTPCSTNYTEEWILPSYPTIELDDLQHSPKCIDQMLDVWSSFTSPLTEEFYEEGDIHLWSFC
ncbi:hypothetical protein L1049_021280 [Liquidambar formosana]|uniref:AP2/ERF domain-containing protein n=1 Tax=Liquidambar formosana TaxID=63359 RepID=A0AAP0XAR7_LIQFO